MQCSSCLCGWIAGWLFYSYFGWQEVGHSGRSQVRKCILDLLHLRAARPGRAQGGKGRNLGAEGSDPSSPSSRTDQWLLCCCFLAAGNAVVVWELLQEPWVSLGGRGAGQGQSWHWAWEQLPECQHLNLDTVHTPLWELENPCTHLSESWRDPTRRHHQGLTSFQYLRRSQGTPCVCVCTGINTSMKLHLVVQESGSKWTG